MWATEQDSDSSEDEPMKYLITYVPKIPAPPTPEQLTELGKFSQEMAKAGVLLMTGGLERPSRGLRVERAAGKFSVTDGPYAETKELIDGFALIQAKSKEEAIEWGKRFMNIVGDGECEVLQVYDSGEIPGC
jgi:hypothetical protein